MLISKEDALTMKNEPMNVSVWSNKYGHQVLMNVPMNENMYIKYAVSCADEQEAKAFAALFTNRVPCGHFHVIA